MTETTGKGSRSHLERLLRGGKFVVTCELRTIDSADPDSVRKACEPLQGYVDAINCTDNATAHPHLCQLAASRLLIDNGLEPITQFSCRDRNRLGLQADILGAASLGVRNLVLMQGDDVSVGDHPDAMPLWDLDSMHLLRVAAMLRDQGVYLSGRKLTHPPEYFIGAVANPFAPPHDFRPLRLGKKVEAGAEFIQTQIVYNLPRLREFMKRVEDLGLLEKVFILPSVAICRSARAVHYMRDHVPGIDVPIEIIKRMEQHVRKEDQVEEGIRIATETVQALREIRGVAGIHLIAIKWEEVIGRVVEASGLLPRPTPAVKTVSG
ncbi:MAG: methylenetetrahydrofolate reductase [Acidobacteria bacterium]|nr:methylenetetrahydrofolate reductase [Acidobacteriota bacterium]